MAAAQTMDQRIPAGIVEFFCVLNFELISLCFDCIQTAILKLRTVLAFKRADPQLGSDLSVWSKFKLGLGDLG